jgi:hypothetical protein
MTLFTKYIKLVIIELKHAQKSDFGVMVFIRYQANLLREFIGDS